MARSADFKEFAHGVAMHIASAAPGCISREELDPDVLEKEKAILSEELKKVPEQEREKAIEGKLNKGFYALHCLLDQPYVRDEKKTVEDMLNDLIAKTGENCKIARFSRMQLGEE